MCAMLGGEGHEQGLEDWCVLYASEGLKWVLKFLIAGGRGL